MQIPDERPSEQRPDWLPRIDPADLAVLPLERAETIPSVWYTSARFDRLDAHAVFERAWQYAGPASRVDGAGSYMSATVAGNPVVIVRDGQTLRAFFNVCRHRGGPLVTAECGVTRMLQCQYHGWTYRLDGMLRGVPRFDRTELFDRKNYGLTPVEVTEWNGLVFVRICESDVKIAPTLVDIETTILPMSIAHLKFDRRVTYDVNCNWKVYVDNYLEGYHLPLVHPELCDVLDYANYTTETYEHHSLQHSPMRGSASEDDRAFYYFVYPNFMLNILPGRLQTNVVIPDGPDHCFVHFDYYYDPDVVSSDRTGIRADQDFAEKVQQEDIEICQHVQRGLKSRGYDRGRFSYDAENGVHHFQSLLKNDYARYVTATSA
jgi:choline monooxygenase